VPVAGGNSGTRELAMGVGSMQNGSMKAGGDSSKPAAKPVDYTERAKAAIKKVDTNGNGRLSFAEVIAAVGGKTPKETVEKTLARFDADGDQELDLAETAAALKVLQP
jgi:hypothetical protein